MQLAAFAVTTFSLKTLNGCPRLPNTCRGRVCLPECATNRAVDVFGQAVPVSYDERIVCLPKLSAYKIFSFRKESLSLWGNNKNAII